MKTLQKAFAWICFRFEAWVSKVGEESRLEPYDSDCVIEESQFFTDSDRIADEKGEFGDRYGGN